MYMPEYYEELDKERNDKRYELFLDGMHGWFEKNGTYSKIVYPPKEAVLAGLQKVLDNEPE